MGSGARRSRARRSRKTIRRPPPPPPQRALEIDPHLADAELLLAELDLDNTHYAEARERIERVLGMESGTARRHRAARRAITYVRGDTSAFEAEVARALAINPIVRRNLSRRGRVVGAQLPV